MAGTVFRDYTPSEGLRSDRSSSDRQRHREKVRRAIRDNIADIVAEQSIIGQSGDKIVKVPLKGIKEYRFVYGSNAPGVATGDGSEQVGQSVGKTVQRQGQGPGRAGNEAGVDYYETEVSLNELIDIMFEDLELPDLDRRKLRETFALRNTRRLGTQRSGIRAHLDKRRTLVQRIKRKIAAGPPEPAAQIPAAEPQERFPFHQKDMRFKRRKPDIERQSNAAVFCLMDTSGSMDVLKKYLARSFFFLLFNFVRTRYESVEIVFIAHHTEAREVTEEEFFHKGESGGTLISSAYEKALEIIAERFHPELWNIYAFHCSDGDNFDSDNEAAMATAHGLCQVCNLFGYGEIKPDESASWSDSSMLKHFAQLKDENFQAVKITRREDLWAAFKSLLSRENTESGAA